MADQKTTARRVGIGLLATALPGRQRKDPN